MRLIDADALKERMYHDAFETDTDMQKWNSGCWIRYKLFENAMDSAPTIDAVSVVRCKECKHTNSEPPIADGRSWCVLHGCFMYYCSDGEREGE